MFIEFIGDINIVFLGLDNFYYFIDLINKEWKNVI